MLLFLEQVLVELKLKIITDKDVKYVTIVDKHNYHLFQPLLYQVSTLFSSRN